MKKLWKFAIFSTITLTTALTHADQLTVYVYPSPLGIDWTSPNSLTWSTITNSLYQDTELLNIHSIGHLNFDLECNGAHTITGQTSEGDWEQDAILKEGYGLGVSLTPSPGRWETAEEISYDLPIRFSRGSVAFMQFAISSSTCARVQNYLQEYQQKNLDKIYGGLQSRARYQEGAGCSNFAESVMEIAGVMTPEWYSSWQQQVNMQLGLIGGPMTGNKVELTDLLFGFDSYTWATDPKDTYALTFWDPQSIYDWIKLAAKKQLPLTGMTYTPVKNKKAYGIVIDAQSISTPTESFWKQD